MSFWSNLFGGGEAAVKLREEAHAIVAAGGTLLDVRTPGEFSTGHLEGARNIPVQDLGARLRELDRAKGVVLYCRSGSRSAHAAALLRQAGFQSVVDIGTMARYRG